jgi:hypothetical protein
LGESSQGNFFFTLKGGPFFLVFIQPLQTIFCTFDPTSRNQACSNENLVLALQIIIIQFKNNIMAFEHQFMTSSCP